MRQDPPSRRCGTPPLPVDGRRSSSPEPATRARRGWRPFLPRRGECGCGNPSLRAGGGKWDAAGPAIPPVRDPSVAGGRASFLVTRTGYTGEAGFELFPTAAEGLWVWESLLKSGADLGIQPIGLGARDTLRLEKGFLLSGQDFDGHQTPLEVNCAWVVKWGRPFIGREALETQRARDDYPRLVGVRMDDRGIPRPGHRVLSRGVDVGHVASGTMSPSLRVGIALASVDRGHVSPETRLQIDVRGTPHAARVVPLPFL